MTTAGFMCPQCGAWTSVLETRGMVRKRECANLHRFFTQETYLGPSNTRSPKPTKVKKQLDTVRILYLLEKNKGNQRAAAREMGVAESTYKNWVRKLKEQQDEKL